MHALLRSYLAFLAILIIKLKKPFVIGVTGTVGKTTLTQMIAGFLQNEYGQKNIGYSRYHYNGEYGLPLTIIGARSGGKNPFLWIWVAFVAIYRLASHYPHYLILEYGIDHPGEMDFLMDTVRPDIAIVTPIVPNHIEQFGDLDTYRQEKLKITIGTHHVIAHESLRAYIDREAFFYGLGARADIDASDIHIDIDGTSALVHYKREVFPVHLPMIGRFQIENVLPLYAIADISHLPKTHIDTSLSHYAGEAGRSRLFHGKYQTTIIDGTYNGGYISIREGVESMRTFLTKHRVYFFLGDMRELGSMSAELHTRLAHDIIDMIHHDADVAFFLIGPLMSEYVAPILEKKYRVYTSLSSREGGKIIAKMLQDNEKPTIIYAKGSQNTIFLEEGLKYFLQKSDYSRLCRQSPHWLDTKERFFVKIQEKIK